VSVVTYRLINADVLAGLRTLPDESVHCCVTSPPYWGLRDYGTAGQIGLEPTPEEYVARMVEVFREVRRVLRRDGTLWLNLGDSYAGSWGAQSKREGEGFAAINLDRFTDKNAGRNPKLLGLKPKDLIGVPWRIAFALQADGWYLRSDIIWSKPNPMPESMKDRPTKAHEDLFLLAKSERYYYDADAIKEPATDMGRENGRDGRAEDPAARPPGTGPRTLKRLDYTTLGRNKRSVWTVAIEKYPNAHFATFPSKLVEPCILAGCP
jgi:DNA modification methylase